ncbi:hypothetical protein ACLOJK_016552 [Asimina triloba]
MDRDTEAEGPAIRAIASLFKITHSYLWDDALVDMPEISSVSIRRLDGSIEELNMRLVTAKEKRKGPRPKSVSSFKHVKNRLAEVPTVSEKDGVVPPIICKDSASTSVCSVETNGHSGSSHHCFAEESSGVWFLSGEGHFQEQVSSKDIIGGKMQYNLGHDGSPDDIVSKKNAGFISPVTPDIQNTFVVASSFLDPKVDGDSEGSSAADCTEATKVPIDNGNEQTLIFDAVDSSESPISCLGDWMAVWDDFYARNYFYNIKTNESTWNPPPGMEHLSFSDWAAIPSGTNTDSAQCDVTSVSTCDDAKIDVICELQNNIALTHEVKDPDDLSGSPPQLLTTSMEHTMGNTFSCLAASKTSDKHVHLDELVEKTMSSDDLKISGSEFCPVPFHSSEIYTTIKSFQDIVNPYSSEEVWESMEQQGLLDCKADELCKLNDLDRPGGDGTCKQTDDELSDDALIKLSEAERFDDGIKTDEEGLFSITPEAIARHHASRCGSGTVIDCFTGVGGNAIQFAMRYRLSPLHITVTLPPTRSKHVIAIDIDPQKIDCAQHNAVIYGVNEKIDFIKGDFFQLASNLKVADTLFMSPPWGGPDYSKVQTFDIRTMLKPCDGYFLFKTAMRIASRIVMFLPRNVDLNQLAELSNLAHPPWELEVEKNYLNGKLKAITAYFSEVLL